MKNDKHFFHFDETDLHQLFKDPSISPSHMQNHSESILTSILKQTTNTLYILHYQTLSLKTDKDISNIYTSNTKISI